jgi:hypothetical protein
MSTVPLSGTNIRLLSGIPFSNDYKHTRWFDDKTSQTNWFLAQNAVHSIAEANFQRIDPGHFVAVNQSIDELWGVNYVMFQNATYNNKWFYAFVTKLEYKQKNTTYVYFQMDVLQTWMFDMNFKPSFVVREHCLLWNADGSPVINTIDEGLNYGTEYNVVDVQKYRPCDDVYFLVVCAKQGMHGTVNKNYYGSINGLPQLLVYYIHPFKLDGSVPGCNLGSLSALTDFLYGMYVQDNAVNNIVSMYITDCLPNNPSYNNSTLGFDSSNFDYVTLSNPANGVNLNTIFVSDQTYASWIFNAGNKYVGYTTPDESKLFMYPYTVVEIVDFKGNKAVYKNEYIDGQDLLISIQSSLGTSQKTVYSMRDYLTSYFGDDNDKEKVSIETGLISNEPNDIPILSDMLSAYLQGNRNSIANQKASIVLNNGASMASAITSMLSSAFAGATAGMVGGPVGAGAGAVIGGAVGAIQGGIGAAKSGGNMALQLQALQAKQQDISNTPPQLAKMGNNTYFDYGNGYTGVWIIKKEITEEYRKKLSDYFNLFGYKKNEVKIPNFHTRQYWNFVQTNGCFITGTFNHEDLQELKNIFDGGITLWHTDDIGNYSLKNEVIA